MANHNAQQAAEKANRLQGLQTMSKGGVGVAETGAGAMRGSAGGIFGKGEKVTWTKENRAQGIPFGAVGEVMGTQSNGLVQVQFPRATKLFAFPVDQLRKAGSESG